MASSAASKNGMSISRANCSTRSTVLLPTPRRGTLTTRLAAMSSAGFTTSVRYAMTSRISARSKKRVPPTMRYGTPARSSMSSSMRLCAFVR